MKLPATDVTIAPDQSTSMQEWPELRHQRKAIVVVDVVESVRLMQANEADVIDRWRRFVNEVRTQVLPLHGGRLVKSLGDGLLLEFESVTSAVAATFEIQRRSRLRNAAQAQPFSVVLRAGVHVADVVIDLLDVYGSGVNLAARLVGLAVPGGIVVSAPVRDELCDGVDADIEDLGDCYLKSLVEPVRAFRLHDGASVDSPSAGAAAMGAGGTDLRPAVAVLPLLARGAPADQGVVGDVVADEVSMSLSRCTELRVISRLSTSVFKNRVDSGSAASLLGADYVISGSYHLEGDQIRVVIELCDSASSEILWADSSRASVSALMRGQEPMVEQVVASIGAAIVSREVLCATSRPLPNVQSHALMSAAVALMHRSSKAQFAQSRAMIDHLRERHPRLPQPHAWLAKWHVLRVVQGFSPDPAQDGQWALDAGHRALDGDAQSSLALTMQGLVHAYLLRDFGRAQQSYQEALQINPNESMALLLLGTMHAFLGEGAQAWPLTESSLRLSPLDPLRYFYLSLSASAAISAQRYDDAVELAQRSLRANKHHLSTYRALALAQSLSGRVEEARETVAEVLRLEPGFTATKFLARYPGRDDAPEYTRLLADAFRAAGLPE